MPIIINPTGHYAYLESTPGTQISTGPGTLTGVLASSRGLEDNTWISLFDTAVGNTSGTEIMVDFTGTETGLNIAIANGIYAICSGKCTVLF